MKPTAYYQLTSEATFANLKSTERGLTSAEAKLRFRRYGANKLTAKRRISPLSVYLSQFKNSLILILLGAAMLILFIWYFGERDQADLVEAALIGAIIFLITLLGFLQEWKAEKAIDALKQLLAYKAKVVRDGEETLIDVAELVPGDIVILDEGAKVPADMRLIEVASLSVGEASLTGESVPVSKQLGAIKDDKALGDQTNMVFSGTSVVQGRAVGVVVATGNNTEIGKIATLVTETEDEDSPLQQRLDKIGKTLGYIVLGVSALVFVFIYFFDSEFMSLAPLQRTLHAFIAAIALAVAAIPEGLPAVVTIALALGTQRMAQRNALVRKLNSVETLGSTNVICADKTGTLTKGEMTVRQIYINGDLIEVSGSGYALEGDLTLSGKPVKITEGVKQLLMAGAVCNNAVLSSKEHLGDPTELALLVSARKAGVEASFNRTHEIPFSSERKMMSVVVKSREGYVMYAKGAPEVLLQHCTHILDGGKSRLLKDSDRELILEQTEHMSEQALRTLGFAYREVARASVDREEGLIFLGLQGMIDPARKEIAALIKQCNASGIRVIMITGDHGATAAAVAQEIGISGYVKTGEELNRLSPETFKRVINEVNIYARVNPDFKMRIVEALKEAGHTVAMTGDGVNDAPALKRADMGIAMGITGTDVAKESSDMVLLDDQFKTIVTAIEEGRGIFHNIAKFVNYLLSCNIGEVIVVFLGVIIFHDPLFTATMLLWINIVTDGLPAVALAMDPHAPHIMKASPRDFQGEIVTKQMWLEMIVFGLLMAGGLLWLYSLNIDHGQAAARSAVFVAIIIMEIVRLFTIRREYKTPMFSNIWLWLALAASIILQLMLTFVPVLSRLFELTPLNLQDWASIVIATAGVWLAFEAYLLIRERVSSVLVSRIAS